MTDEDAFEALRRAFAFAFAQAHAIASACERVSLPCAADETVGADLECLCLAIVRHPVQIHGRVRVKFTILPA